jgi:hypothetical protein
MIKYVKNKEIKIGIVGRNFGNIVALELKDLHEIAWKADSTDNLNNLADVDIAYIASPTEFHFEHSKLFLEKKIAVVVEKPPTLSSEALTELIDLARINGTFIYFSDLFRFREDITKNLQNIENVTWSKVSVTKDWVACRLAYHYLYLFADDLIKNETLKVQICHKDRLKFSLDINDREISFDFSQNANLNLHKIDDCVLESGLMGPISKMLSSNNLTKNAININNRNALGVVKFLEMLRKFMPKINVIGGGIFGSQTAISLAKSGVNVTLYEKNNELISQASAINQYRVHRGYHYPRSAKTVAECQNAMPEFLKNFGQAIITDHTSHYAIASNKSKVNPEQYKNFLSDHCLPYEEIQTLKNCKWTAKVDEYIFSPSILKQLINYRLHALGVDLKLGKAVSNDEINQTSDLVVLAVYSDTGSFDGMSYQHEICEKPVVRLPKKYKGKSYVIMDGPFMCIDPFDDTEFHVMGNVVHAIHSTNIGITPIIPKNMQSFIDKGIIPHTKIQDITNYKNFKKTYDEFFDYSDEIEHVGSMFTVRSVLPNRDHDDARPTEVRRVDENKLLIFSGKVVTCVSSANKVLELAW